MTNFASSFGVNSPDETGEVARVSATKGGRAVEPAAVALPHFKKNPSLNNEKNRRPILLDKFTVFPLKSVLLKPTIFLLRCLPPYKF